MEIFKLGHIFKIKEYENLKNYACALEIKETVNGNDLVKEFFLLVAIREDINDYYLIPHIKDNSIEIIDLGTFQQYSKKNKIEIFNIKEYAQSKNIYLSWLEAIQINELNKDNHDTLSNIKKLSNVYNKIIPIKNNNSGFLDF